MMIQFENLSFSAIHQIYRTAAVVGDALATAIGKPASLTPPLVFNVVDQPSGSNVFNGLGTAGADVPLSQLSSATLATAEVYQFRVSAADAVYPVLFDVIVFPAQTLEVAQIKYATKSDRAGDVPRPARERRLVLRSLAMHATKSGAEAALEGGAAAAPYYGLVPALVGQSSIRLADYGGSD